MTDVQSATKRSRLGALPLWGGVATVFGLASDFARPIGPFALYLLILFAVACIASFAMSRTVPAARHAGSDIAKYTLVGVLIFTVVVALQVMTKDEAEPDVDRGFLASVVPPVASAQEAVLTVEAGPVDEFDAALRQALRAKDDLEKRTAARLALSSVEAEFRQTAIERLYRSKDPTLRRQAVLAIFAARGRNGVPVVVVEDEGNDPNLVSMLTGETITFTNVDTEVGKLDGYIHKPYDGNVALNGITLAISYQEAVVKLVADDDFTLRGTYTHKDGASVKIEALLN